MKLALVLAVIDPSLGGVLIRGTKGIAKSTTVRALAALLPEIDVVAGCPFHREPGDAIDCWPLSSDAPAERRRVPLVEMPIGSTEDRVIGSIDLERAIESGRRTFEPGLLAAANRGILYIDEVNLLGDHLVDILLDAAAMGTNHVEREGVSVRHPARFALVGTMNPEEGGLRPQLLDRFGLVVDAADIADPELRAEAVRRRIAFDRDHAAFAGSWEPLDQAESRRIAGARQRLGAVRISDETVLEVTRRCVEGGCDGLRGDLTLCKAACAHAAYFGRDAVAPEDVEAVAELALGHRRTREPSPPPSSGPSRDGNHSGNCRLDRGTSTPRPTERPVATSATRSMHSGEATNQSHDDETAQTDLEPNSRCDSDLISAVGPLAAARRIQFIAIRRCGPARAGRRAVNGTQNGRGLSIGAELPRDQSRDLALAATVRAAAPFQVVRRLAPSARAIELRLRDLRIHRREQRSEHLVLFVVDASRSMGALGRMRETKSTILSLLVDAYQKRDRVGLITFCGRGARLVLPPTRSLRVARRLLADLTVAGTTPLAHGLELAREQITLAWRRDSRARPLVVLVTDGRSNVALRAGSDPWQDAAAAAARLAELHAPSLVVDTESGYVRLGLARRLAAILNASCFAPAELTSGPPAAQGARESLCPLAG